MRTGKLVLIAASALMLQSCATAHRPLPMPEGKLEPVNSLDTAEMLAHEAGLVIVGEERDLEAVREHFLYGDQLLIAKPKDERMNLIRPTDPNEFAQVDGARIVERTVVVPFSFGSSKFEPTAEQKVRILQLIAVADRVDVRGRTDGKKVTEADSKMARLRAEAAKRYLLDRGMPSNLISVNYQAAGDYIADNEQSGGANRRVEIEFVVEDFVRASL